MKNAVNVPIASMYAKIANQDVKGAKRLAKNRINAEVVKIVINVENANIVKVAKVMSAITVKLAKHHAKVDVNRLVKQVVKHRVSQAAKRAHRQTRHRQHRQQLQFRRKLRAATQ